MSLRTPSKLTLNGTPATWTNMPSALTEFLGSTGYRTKVDLTDADQARLCVNVVAAGAAGAVIGVQYSTDGGSTWTTAFTVPISAAGCFASAWANIPAAAKTDVLVRLGGQGGNGTADPQIGLVVLEFVGVPGDFGAAGLCHQIVSNLYGLTRDMRDNANGYTNLANAIDAGTQPAGVTAATVISTMKADAANYTTRLGWFNTAYNSDPTGCTEALALLGYTVAQANGLITALQAVATHTTNTTLATTADIRTEASYQLANVPSYTRLW